MQNTHSHSLNSNSVGHTHIWWWHDARTLFCYSDLSQIVETFPGLVLLANFGLPVGRLACHWSMRYQKMCYAVNLLCYLFLLVISCNIKDYIASHLVWGTFEKGPQPSPYITMYHVLYYLSLALHLHPCCFANVAYTIVTLLLLLLLLLLLPLLMLLLLQG